MSTNDVSFSQEHQGDWLLEKDPAKKAELVKKLEDAAWKRGFDEGVRSTKPKKSKDLYTPAFERFWKAFPTEMRGTKTEAAREFTKLGPNEVLLDDLLEKLAKQVQAIKNHEEGRGVFFARLKQAGRWIKYRCWENDVPEPFRKNDRNVV